MTRRHLTFACAGDTLVATLDAAPSRTALLLVSGGNEVRAGAWNGQALFAERIAACGFAVLRFDRRGVGDSEGTNRGFEDAGEDIVAACAALRRECPHVTHVVGMGNCDAASALMLAGGAGLDGLILSNPWTIEDDSEEAPVEVVRDHYRRRLADPAAIRRLLTGKVSVLNLARSLLSALRKPPAVTDGLAARLATGIAGFSGPVRFVVAGRDRTGLAFVSRWDKDDRRIHRFANATHSYVEPEAQDWLVQQTLAVLSTFNG